MVNIERLYVFLEVAETLSFSETAQRLHVSQPTVSKHIHDLESELGVQLFERTGAKPRLTETGRTLLPWARKLVKQSNVLEDMARSIKQDVSGSSDDCMYHDSREIRASPARRPFSATISARAS